MTSGNFWDFSIWELLLSFAGIVLASLIANVIIQSIKPLKKALIPAPVLGGFLLLIFLTVYKNIFDKELINTELLEIITYHALGIGFVAGGLKNNRKEKKATQGSIIKSSLFTIGGYALQAIVGLIITITLFFIIGSWPASGVILPMGFGQGPGQAFNWGFNYQNLTEATSAFGSFENGKDFGLSIAAMGFIAASIGGVIYLNIQKHKGNSKMIKSSSIDHEEHLSLEDYESEGEIASSDSLDKATVQVGLVLVIYAISFALLYLISFLCDKSGVNLLINTIKPLFWGFNFIFGVAVASIYKIVFKTLKKHNVIKKEYTNNYMMDRISGFAFDVMVVAAFGAIDLSAFLKPTLILPLILICLIGGVITYFYCDIVTKKVFNEYKDEQFLAFYGMLTGTNATGIILLREIDPQFKSPACDNMVFQSLYSIALGAPILLSLSSVCKNWTQLLIWLSVYIVFFALLMFFLFLKKKNKEENLNAQE